MLRFILMIRTTKLLFFSDKSTRPKWSEFLMSTTLNGLVHFHMSERRVQKAVWIAVFLGLSAATVFNTFPMIMQEFLSYPVDVKVSDSEGADGEPFPAVTVCMYNPIDCITLTRAYLQNREELRKIMYLSSCPIYLGRTTSLLKQVG